MGGGVGVFREAAVLDELPRHGFVGGAVHLFEQGDYEAYFGRAGAVGVGGVAADGAVEFLPEGFDNDIGVVAAVVEVEGNARARDGCLVTAAPVGEDASGETADVLDGTAAVACHGVPLLHGFGGAACVREVADELFPSHSEGSCDGVFPAVEARDAEHVARR